MTQAQGSKGLLSLQYEAAYGVTPGYPNAAKIYFESEGFKASKNLISSNILTGSRQASKPYTGNTDVQGSVVTELGGHIGTLLYGGCGSVVTTENSGTGEVLATALTTPSGVIDAENQTLTITCGAAHNLSPDDMVYVLGITAPAALNGQYLRVMNTTAANVAVLRIQQGLTTTWTLGGGTLKKVSTAATTYQHLIRTAGVLPSFLVCKGFPDIAQYFRYSGCKIGKINLNLVAEGVQKATFDFVGQSETVSGTNWDATPLDFGKTSFVGSAIGAITQSQPGVTTLTNRVTNLDISVDNTLDSSLYCLGGSGARQQPTAGVAKVTGTLECVFDDITQYSRAVSGAGCDLLVTIGSGSESLEIYLPELILKQDTPTISGDKGILISLAFEAHTSTCQFVLKNNQLAI